MWGVLSSSASLGPVSPQPSRATQTLHRTSEIFQLHIIGKITEGHGGHSQEHLERVHEGDEGEEQN